VLRQNSIRTENSAIPCRDGCPIQVIPSPSRAKNLPEERPRGIPVYIRMEEPGRFRDATSVRIRQPDRIGGAALPVAVPRQNSIRDENRAIPCRDNLKRKPGWDLRARRLSPGVNTRVGYLYMLCKDRGTRSRCYKPARKLLISKSVIILARDRARVPKQRLTKRTMVRRYNRTLVRPGSYVIDFTVGRSFGEGQRWGSDYKQR